jgi:uncharacterized protein YjhX (UPF0386 family)
LEEIRDNLEARIIEAKCEGWLGEVEGLQVSLSGGKDKIARIDSALGRLYRVTALGLPSFKEVAGWSSKARSGGAAASLRDGSGQIKSVIQRDRPS